jgi:hypothetical protein
MAKRKSTRIITILQIGKTTVDRDLVYLRKQAQENLKLHIQERLPEQYQKCMIGLNQVLKMGWDIVHNDSSTAARSNGRPKQIRQGIAARYQRQ